jgi:L-ribulokinase
MGRRGQDTYRPDPARADEYDALFAEYRQLHDLFGSADHQQSAFNGALHRLRRIRNAALRSAE